MYIPSHHLLSPFIWDRDFSKTGQPVGCPVYSALSRGHSSRKEFSSSRFTSQSFSERST